MLISPQQAQDGVTSVNAAAVNNPINTIANDYNGNIDNTNIAAAAAIAGSKINIASFSNPYKFSVYRSVAWNKGNGIEVINFDTKTFDTGTNYDNSTNYRFTAPIAGFFFFSAAVNWSSNADQTQYWLGLYKNGSQLLIGNNAYTSSASQVMSPTVAALVQLAANDYIDVRGFWGGSSVSGTTGAVSTWFTGHYLSAT